MSWTNFQNRGEVLRAVIATADARRDGVLPLDVDGVAETFGDAMTLLGALQLRWHTRLAGRIEQELMHQPMNLEEAVIAAWHATADELPGILAIVDHYRAEPIDNEMALAMLKSAHNEHLLLAVMAGKGSLEDEAAARAGAQLEAKARATHVPTPHASVARIPQGGRHAAHTHHVRLMFDRLKAVLAA
ncbi:hypothetical protein [Nocardioides sp.]|uniref:hypothetical protein n=1 Tax=Nocardioides sp. TaxID=35761 RepID=UPI0035627450